MEVEVKLGPYVIFLTIILYINANANCSVNLIACISFVDLSICAIVRSDPLSIPEDVFHPTFKLSFVIDKMQNSNSKCFKSSKKKFLTFIELTILI